MACTFDHVAMTDGIWGKIVIENDVEQTVSICFEWLSCTLKIDWKYKKNMKTNGLWIKKPCNSPV